MDALGISANTYSPFGEKPKQILSGYITNSSTSPTVNFQSGSYIVLHILSTQYFSSNNISIGSYTNPVLLKPYNGVLQLQAFSTSSSQSGVGMNVSYIDLTLTTTSITFNRYTSYSYTILVFA